MAKKPAPIDELHDLVDTIAEENEMFAEAMLALLNGEADQYAIFHLIGVGLPDDEEPEEEEKPARGRRAKDEDEDDKPARGRRGRGKDEDEDEDKPARGSGRRGSKDEEEDEPAPRRRRR